MEFKGTKGKWVIKDYRQETVLSLSKDRKDIVIAECGNFYDVTGSYHRTHEDEQNANALLISKAPEMLEMLHKAKLELSRIKGSMMAHPDCEEGSEFDDYTNSAEEVENEIEQLIKQATEL